jgi:sec-independent protein translocase protein TatC
MTIPPHDLDPSAKQSMDGAGVPGSSSSTQRAMPLLQHLDELRTRLTRSVGIVMAAFFLILFRAQDLINFLKGPLIKALPPGVPALHFTGPMDVMFVGMKVSFMAAVIVTSPVWLREFWKFFEPGLYPAERKYVLPFIWGSVVLFLTGVGFCYFIALPFTLEFLIKIGVEVGVPIITVTDYVNLFILLFAGFGLVFETPLILVLLSLLDVIDSKTLTSQRRAMVVVILIIAALLTPGPDPVSQFIMAIPLFGLFELSILIIRRLEKGREKSQSAAVVLVFLTMAGAMLCGAEGKAFAEADRTKFRSFYSFGAGLASHALKSDVSQSRLSDHKILGPSGRVNLGYTKANSRWDFGVSANLVLGPYKPVYPVSLPNPTRLDVDYNGKGVTFVAAYRLRAEAEGSPAVVAGVSYMDMSGRSLGGKFESGLSSAETSQTTPQVADNYAMRTAQVSAVTGFSWNANWAKARNSNSPSDLKTTVDGVSLSIWAELPLVTAYSAEFDVISGGENPLVTAYSDRGGLKGYSLVFQATALFGS